MSLIVVEENKNRWRYVAYYDQPYEWMSLMEWFIGDVSDSDYRIGVAPNMKTYVFNSTMLKLQCY